jgi:class 3 adenylate cyclase/tetratricopeptide (TPR) repeat protein
MTCSNCGATNDPGQKFCGTCGTSLAVTCPACGAANKSGARFCGECGNALSTAAGMPVAEPRPRLAAASVPVAERRIVSVLFADLVGFTTLAEGRDPEETRDLLTRYFSLAREVIDRYGGTVEKFIGDAVMAVWGAPVAREDDAELAVRAALELVDTVVSLGPSIQARAGVLTGEAAVTIGAVGQGMVAGDLVNTASRLQSVAAPGSVLVGEATERAASRAISFEPLGEQALKGKAAPVPAWRAKRVVAELGGTNRADRLEAPFVGRDDELRLLKDLFHATGRDQRPRLISVMGPGGIGKSRLAWEFLKYVGGLVETTWWHSGRSPAYGQGITFWALGEMIRRRAGLLETDDEPTTRQKVADTVARWVPADDERRWIEPALLALLGLEQPPSGGRDELFAAWRTFFERIAATGPTVLLFEDLQWADAGVLDFIDHLFEWTKSLPILVITLARPDLLERRPDWGAGRRNFVSLALDPLPEPVMRDLLTGLVPGLSASVAKAIVARADGIPLYAVETVRMLVADGRLKELGGTYEPVGDLTTLAIPETLTALISARLDSLEPAERGLLQDAAVLGQSFSLAALAAVTSGAAEALEPTLRTLVRRELLNVNGDPRSPERGQYVFVQALIREVAYNRLAHPERKVRHLAAARWFESLGEDELAGALAQHYADAYRNAPKGPEADALSGQARLALKGAAERASSLGSHAQALGFLDQALGFADEPAERASLLERAAGAADKAADYESARRYLEEAISWYRGQGDRIAVARTSTSLSVALHKMLQPIPSVAVLEAAVAETAGLEAEPDVIGLIAELSRAYGRALDPRGLETADRALALAEPLELMPIIAEALLNRALALSGMGRLQEPIALLRGVLTLAEAHDLAPSQLRAINNLAAILEAEDPRAAHDVARSGIEVARRRGDRGWMLNFLGGGLNGAILLGEWEEADRILADVEISEVPRGLSLEFLWNASLLHALRGQAEAADAKLEEVASLGATLDDPRAGAWQLANAAVVHALAGRLPDAYDEGMAGAESPVEPGFTCAEWATRAALWLGDGPRARAALTLFEARSERGRMVAAQRQTLRAGVRALEGDREGAIAGYRDVIRTWQDMDVPVYLGLTLAEFASLVGPGHPEASAAADEARAIWTRLGSPALLNRLDAGLARWRPADDKAPPDELEKVDQPEGSASPSL